MYVLCYLYELVNWTVCLFITDKSLFIYKLTIIINVESSWIKTNFISNSGYLCQHVGCPNAPIKCMQHVQFYVEIQRYEIFMWGHLWFPGARSVLSSKIYVGSGTVFVYKMLTEYLKYSIYSVREKANFDIQQQTPEILNYLPANYLRYFMRLGCRCIELISNLWIKLGCVLYQNIDW